jgi:hypothetical protein
MTLCIGTTHIQTELKCVMTVIKMLLYVDDQVLISDIDGDMVIYFAELQNSSE